MDQKEGLKWKTTALLEKYHGDIEEYRSMYGEKDGERRFYSERRPYETVEVEGNLLLQDGCYELLQLLVGSGGVAFEGAPNNYARIGVGDSNAPAAVAQTDLQGASKDYHAMEALYPDIGVAADMHVHFKSSFGAGHAEWAWEEWIVDNKGGGGGGAACLNRRVVSLGTKPAGTTWTLTVTISLS